MPVTIHALVNRFLVDEEVRASYYCRKLLLEAQGADSDDKSALSAFWVEDEKLDAIEHLKQRLKALRDADPNFVWETDVPDARVGRIQHSDKADRVKKEMSTLVSQFLISAEGRASYWLNRIDEDTDPATLASARKFQRGNLDAIEYLKEIDSEPMAVA